MTDASFSLSGDVLATAAEDGTVRVWDTGAAALLEADPFPRSMACLHAFRAAPEGSTLSRVLVVGADSALVTGDEENRLLKVGIHVDLQFRVFGVSVPREKGPRPAVLMGWGGGRNRGLELVLGGACVVEEAPS